MGTVLNDAHDSAVVYNIHWDGDEFSVSIRRDEFEFLVECGACGQMKWAHFMFIWTERNMRGTCKSCIEKNEAHSKPAQLKKGASKKATKKTSKKVR